jgi:hypothetical protein
MMLLIVFICIELIDKEQTFLTERHNNYIQLAQTCFSTIIILILFGFGLKLKKMITLSLKDTFDHLDLNYYIEEAPSIEFPGEEPRFSDSGRENLRDSNEGTIQLDLSDQQPYLKRQDSTTSQTKEAKQHKKILQAQRDREIYFNKRRRQINIITSTFLICGLVKFFYIISRNFIIQDQFTIVEFETFPETNLAIILEFFYTLCILLPIFTNYIAFYFIIRDSYISFRKRRKTKKIEIFTQRDIFKRSKSNKDIDQFLM